MAQRLEQIGRHFGDENATVNILMSGAIMKELKAAVNTQDLGARKLRGRSERVQVYVLHDSDARTPDRNEKGTAHAVD